MSYGIEINGGIGNLQISSDRSMTAFRVIDSGSSSTITGISGTAPDYLVAISYEPANNGDFKNIAINKLTSDWTVVDENGSAATVNWVVLDLFKSAAASTSGYGIQIFNASSELAYDSQLLLVENQGVTFKETAAPDTFSGNPLNDSNPLTSNLAEYVTVNHCSYTPELFIGYRFAKNTTFASGISHLSYLEFPTEFGSVVSYLPNLSDLFAIKIGSV
jgi:hypothetical protein